MKVKRICKQCGKEFERYQSQIKIGEGTYCSKECRAVFLRTARVGAVLPPEQIEKARQTRLNNDEKIACGVKYYDLWGKLTICRNKRKRYRKTCGLHTTTLIQRYYPSKIHKHVYIDIKS